MKAVILQRMYLSVLAIVEVMSKIKTKVNDPHMESVGAPVNTLFPHEEEVVQKVIEPI